MNFGSFWEFVGNVPSALENLFVPQRPESILTILPTVYLWRNLGVCALIFAAGALLGAMVWRVQPRRRRLPDIS
jgi:hypothetical protein